MHAKILRIALIVVITGLFIYSALAIFNRNSPHSTIISPISQTLTNVLDQTDSKNGLKDVVESSLKGKNGTYGIAIKNLKTNESYYFNEHRVFDVASLYKLWIMAETISQIENGRLREDDVLSQEASVLNEKFNIASESAEKTEGEVTFSVKEALEQMITISHNYAALLLSERVRLSNVSLFLEKNGFYESSIGQPPKTTAYDMAIFLEKLYQGELSNDKYTKEMIDLLKKQKLNHKLPKYLPEDLIIAHKTGELGLFTHDGGIVFSEKGDYIIVIMAQGSLRQDMNENISLVSKNVYEYFTK